MTLDSKNMVRNLTESFLNKPMGRIMTNPITMAFIITVIIMMIVIYTHDDDNTFRTSFRIFGITTIFLFINNHIIMNDMKSSKLCSDTNNILNKIGTEGGSMVVPVDTIVKDDDENYYD
jgi:predicted membrane channel-forming protein YqfA (hemolysin III family)